MSLPLAPTIRWQGTTIGMGFVPRAAPTARAALGRPSESGPGLAASVEYLAGELTTRDWGPATLALDGLPRHDVSGGGGEITGDPMQFVLVATGRAEPATMGLEPGVSIY